MWKVIGASVTGRSHQATATDCEDACGWRADRDITTLVVADGAGSRPLAAAGAALAVEQALSAADTVAVSGNPVRMPELMRAVFGNVRDQIARLATAEEHAIGEYACTLAVAVLTAHSVCVGQIGDTITVVGHKSRYATLAPAPQTEYVNETTFVTDERWTDHIRIGVLRADEADAVFLSTDGLRFKILADLGKGTPYTPFFEDAQSYARSVDANAGAIRRFLAALDDQSGDDKTLLIAVRASLTDGPITSDSLVTSVPQWVINDA